MQFEVHMRDGASYQIEASYLEVTHGPVNTTYTLLGVVPGYPTAILAVFPVELVESVIPATVTANRPRSTGPRTTTRA